MKILTVDDNEAHLYALSRILENAGHEVYSASTGSATLEIAARELPHVVLLDINLPDLSGFEVCQRLKADKRTRNVAVIFHTATHATSAARSQAETVGAISFLTYPISSDHLLSVIEGSAARSRE
jgi:two-component system, sensor histidine kinase